LKEQLALGNLGGALRFQFGNSLLLFRRHLDDRRRFAQPFHRQLVCSLHILSRQQTVHAVKLFCARCSVIEFSSLQFAIAAE
jgi:hypothetical protein